MEQTPTARIRETFGWPGFPDGLFYEARYGLRFDLGGVFGGEREKETVRFLQAMDRARAIVRATFAGAETLTAVVRHYGGEKPARDEANAFERLRRTGFGFPFGPVERVPQHDQEHLDLFGEDMTLCWRQAEFPNHDDPIAALLWISLSQDLAIRPRAPLLGGVYIVDFPGALAVWPYDDRGMDVIANEPAPLQRLYTQFNEWLFDCDRPQMDRTIGQAASPPCTA